MASFTNDLGVKAKLLYRVKGKQYDITATEGATFNPFDEVFVKPGEKVELGDIVWINVLANYSDEARIDKQIEDIFRNSSFG